jgi:hypothetical protein
MAASYQSIGEAVERLNRYVRMLYPIFGFLGVRSIKCEQADGTAIFDYRVYSMLYGGRLACAGGGLQYNSIGRAVNERLLFC